MEIAEQSKQQPPQVDKQFRSLLEGLRTTLPGVQLIAAFLLTMPLYPGFHELGRFERYAYYVAFGSALLSSVLLMAPSSHQRVRANEDGEVQRSSVHHLHVAVRLTVAGTALFAVAITSAGYLVSSIVVGPGAALAVTIVVGVTVGWSWFYLPLVTFERER